jgi:hypothetical protein
VFPSNFVELVVDKDEDDHHQASHSSEVHADEDKEAGSPVLALILFGVSKFSNSLLSLQGVKPKKIHGVGLGNIFQGGMPSLKKTSELSMVCSLQVTSLTRPRKHPLLHLKPNLLLRLNQRPLLHSSHRLPRRLCTS